VIAVRDRKGRVTVAVAVQRAWAMANESVVVDATATQDGVDLPGGGAFSIFQHAIVSSRDKIEICGPLESSPSGPQVFHFLKT
jgi:hypothetical protein